MDGNVVDSESLLFRIQQLERGMCSFSVVANIVLNVSHFWLSVFFLFIILQEYNSNFYL